MPAKVTASSCEKVAASVGALVDSFTPELLEMPQALVATRAAA